MAKEGSTVSGLMDSFATAVSLGAPARRAAAGVLCEKFAHTRFEPSGWAGNEQIGYAKSIMDYIFRWIQIRFLSGRQRGGLRRPRPTGVGSGGGPRHCSSQHRQSVRRQASERRAPLSVRPAASLEVLRTTKPASTPTPPRHPSRESPRT